MIGTIIPETNGRKVEPYYGRPFVMPAIKAGMRVVYVPKPAYQAVTQRTKDVERISGDSERNVKPEIYRIKVRTVRMVIHLGT